MEKEYCYNNESWIPAAHLKSLVLDASTKTIELMEKQATPFTTGYKEGYETATADMQKKLSKKSTIGIIRHEPIDVDAYKCGYEAAVKEIIKKNIITDSTASIIHKNGYEEGYASCVREIEEKLSKDNTISFDSWKQGYTEGCTEFARLLKERMAEFSASFEDGKATMLIDTMLKEMLPRKLDGRVKRMATLKGKVKA